MTAAEPTQRVGARGSTILPAHADLQSYNGSMTHAMERIEGLANSIARLGSLGGQGGTESSSLSSASFVYP